MRKGGGEAWAERKNPRKEGGVVGRGGSRGVSAIELTPRWSRRDEGRKGRKGKRFLDRTQKPLAALALGSSRSSPFRLNRSADHHRLRTYLSALLSSRFDPRGPPDPRLVSKTPPPFFPVATYYLSRPIGPSLAFLSASVFQSSVICQSAPRRLLRPLLP